MLASKTNQTHEVKLEVKSLKVKLTQQDKRIKILESQKTKLAKIAHQSIYEKYYGKKPPCVNSIVPGKTQS